MPISVQIDDNLDANLSHQTRTDLSQFTRFCRCSPPFGKNYLHPQTLVNFNPIEPPSHWIFIPTLISKPLDKALYPILDWTKMYHQLVRQTQRKVKWVGLAKHHAAGKAHYLDSVPDEKAFDA